MSDGATLGLVMLTRNEEEFIADSLKAVVPYVDSAIVIDQNSTDGTPEIARHCGASVIHAPGNFMVMGEKWYRDLAARTCQCDWMMTIDADEIMSDGWEETIRPFLDGNGRNFGAVEIPFYHLIGSYEYHSLDSPMWRPAFVRVHSNLQGTPPMRGPKCHSNYHKNYQPDRVARVDAAKIFHLGYTCEDLPARWEEIILRGDFNYTPEEQRANIAMLRDHPCNGFPQCVPMALTASEYPAALRERVGKTYAIDYDADNLKIRNRVRLGTS